MCTLAIHNIEDDVIITSNRDDHPLRAAQQMQSLRNGDQIIAYPADAKNTGSWLAFDNFQNVAVLLNGGFEKHKKQKHHVLSRGRKVLEVLTHFANPLSCFQMDALQKTEPFTLILVNRKEIRCFVWTGHQIHTSQSMLADLPLFYASKTLYSEEEYLFKRKQCLNLARNKRHDSPQTIQHWFSTPITGAGLAIERQSVQTLSTSQIILSKEGGLNFTFKSHIFPECSWQQKITKQYASSY